MQNDTYYAQIFHEIKNSVTLIHSYLQMFQQQQPEFMQNEYLHISQIETQRLQAMVTELSQFKSGQTLCCRRIHLGDFLKDCCREFHFVENAQHISCNLTLPEEVVTVSVDMIQLRHALLNLLKNAAEAMSTSGNIDISLMCQNHNAIIQIQDYGFGIPSSIINDIFHPFFTTKASGSGLGLHITKNIILAHGGNIDVSSQEQTGTKFTITLPCVQT